jgi:hypothetical protein
MAKRCDGVSLRRSSVAAVLLWVVGCSTGSPGSDFSGRTGGASGGSGGNSAGGSAGGRTGGAGGGITTGGAGTTTGGAGSSGGGGASGGGPCTTAEVFASPLRRMTRFEYNNTTRDLLAVDIAPADRFPPDEVAGGFSNNASVLTVSPLLAEKYMEAAEALAAEGVKKLPQLLPCDPAQAGEAPCARQFIERFGRRAYRRHLAPTDIDRLMRAYTLGRTDGAFATGIEMVMRAMLQSPNFIYRFEIGVAARPGDKLVRLTQHEIAARMSYLLWSSMPDPSLEQVADGGQLSTKEQVATRARAMLDDPRARRAVPEFYRQWLGLGAIDSVLKDKQMFPAFTDDLRAAMRAEMPAFVEHVLWSADRRLSTMLTAPIGFVTTPLAALYGVSVPAGTTPQRVMFDPAERAGLLTQAAFLATHALPNQSSPVTRGKFVRELLMCQPPSAPPPDLNVTPPEVDPTRSTRERFAQHTANLACSPCHAVMDPIGFGFESYDAIGRFRTMDGNKPVDTSGEIVRSIDLDGKFQGARQLAEKLAASRQVHDCVATQWFRYAFGRFDGPGDTCSLAELRQSFMTSGGDLRELLVTLTQTESFLNRAAQEVQP